MGQAQYKDDADVHSKGGSPFSDRRPRLVRRCDSTTATVLLADGMVMPSPTSEHIDSVWAKRTIKTVPEVSLRHIRREGGSTLGYAHEGRLPLEQPWPTVAAVTHRCGSTTATALFVDGMVRPS